MIKRTNSILRHIGKRFESLSVKPIGHEEQLAKTSFYIEALNDVTSVTVRYPKTSFYDVTFKGESTSIETTNLILNQTYQFSKGDRLYIAGHNNFNEAPSSNYMLFTSEEGSEFKIGGNINSLVDDETKEDLELPIKCFCNLFQYNLGLVDASELVLPAKKVPKHTYAAMFDGCKNLVNPPKVLPATSIAGYSYAAMFRNTGITTIPVLDFEEIEYDDEYGGRRACYAMFQGCTNLTKIYQTLHPKTLRVQCYHYMFNGCTNLTEIHPGMLPATDLTVINDGVGNYSDSVYAGMFVGTGINKIYLYATTLSPNCYWFMFQNCKNLTSIILPASHLATDCYRQMFQGCSNLKEIEYFGNKAPNFILWVNGVANEGRFIVRNPTVKEECNNITRGRDTIPTNWAII